MEQPLQSSGGKMHTGVHSQYRIEDRSYFSIIKRDIAKAAEGIGFSAEQIGKLSIIISELASNLLKFGQQKREFLWKQVFQNGQAGIEMLALDKGPGISNINHALQDGFSTSGTAGEGLGAVRRLSHFFDVYSQAGQGTVVLSRLFSKNGSLPVNTASVTAALSVPKPGEELCGDGYHIEFDAEQGIFNILVLDGLGHGPQAHEAAEAALKAYAFQKKESPSRVLQGIHQSIKKTRGGVGMALHYDFKQQEIIYYGVGNISARLVGYDSGKSFISFNGIVGHIMSPRPGDQLIEWGYGMLLIVHSDGINSRWDLRNYPHIQAHDPLILAACLYRDANRGTDDVTIIVSKNPNKERKRARTYY